MRIVSFYSAKGGTGKTTFNLLFASYLRYQKGLRVLFLDFDGPEFNAFFVRQRELERFDGDRDGLYPIEYVEGCRVEPGMTEGCRIRSGMTEEGRLRGKPAMTVFAEKLRGLEGQLDYILLDFAGSFSVEDAVCQLSLAGAIDLIVIPTELDSITIASCKALSRTFAESGQKSMLFFNRVHGKESDELYAKLFAWFEENHLYMSHNRVRNSLAMRRDAESGGVNYMRSSVCFPVGRVVRGNPDIIKLFDEVIEYVQGEKTGTEG